MHNDPGLAPSPDGPHRVATPSAALTIALIYALGSALWILFSDGGVARLRVYGEVQRDWSSTKPDELIALADHFRT